MAGEVVLGFLAAFGAFCVIWTVAGGMLSKGSGGVIVIFCHGKPGEELFLRRCGWLRELGLLKAPLLAVDCGLTDAERRWLEKQPSTEVCTLAQLEERLELERNRID